MGPFFRWCKVGQNSWHWVRLRHRDKKLLLLKTKDLGGGGEKCRSKSVSGVFSITSFFYGPEFVARDFGTFHGCRLEAARS